KLAPSVRLRMESAYLNTTIGIAIFSSHTPNQQTARSILSTLVRVQAGIFAIVFSIVILGVRLSASRYSPRLAKSFSSDSTYRVTVGVFAFSIAIDIFGLFVVGAVSDATLRVVLASSGILAAGSFVSLYGFVNQILERTTPEGILSHIEDKLTPKSMLEEAELSADDAAHPDPFQTLISVINSTIEEHDRASSALGLSIFGDRVSALIKQNGKAEEDSPVDQTIEYVCKDQLPLILEQAVNEELTETAIQSTETAGTIGEAAIKEDSNRAVEHVVRGQAGLIDNLPYETNVERVRTEVIETSQELVSAAAENQVYTGSAVSARFLGWTAASSIMKRDIEDGRNQSYTSLLIRHFPSLISTVAESDMEVNDLTYHQWLRAQNSEHVEPVTPVEQLIGSVYGSMAELTSAAIRYELKTGQQIVRWESVASGWSSGLDSLTQMNLDEMAQLWFGTTLYLEYIARESSSDIMSGFDSYGRHRVTRDIGEETVEKIQDGRLDPTARIDFIPGGVDPIKHPLTGHKTPILQDPDRTFTEWINTQPFIFRGRRFGRVGEPPTDEDLDGGVNQ
ncbi:DUF2254 domain-containing protein, partial [Halorubrum sp. SS5]